MFRSAASHDERIYCGRCGQSVAGAARFCDECGARLAARNATFRVSFGPVVRAGERYPVRIVGIFEDYVLESLVGEGGMGKVYKAMHTWSAQEFAIKMIADTMRLRPQVVKLFAREAETQSSLIHPNVVRVFRFVEQRGQAGLVMELVRGESLDRVLESQGNLPISQVLWLVRSMLAGLEAVHQRDYVHADVKPANFLHGRANGPVAVKVADFGIARRLRSEVLAQRGGRSGTPEYMSPEQWTGSDLTQRSDLFSLGCVLYEMLAGGAMVDLVPGGASHPGWQDRAPDIATVRADVPRQLVDLVRALLQVAPDRRPESARAVLGALDSLQGGAA